MIFTASRTATVLVLTATTVLAYKLAVAGYSLDQVTPAVAWDVRTTLRFEGHDAPVKIRTFVPRDDEHQTVRHETWSAADLSTVEETRDENRELTFSAGGLDGAHAIHLAYRVAGRAERYDLPRELRLPLAVPPRLRGELEPTETIQSDAPEVGELLERIAPAPRSADGTLRAIFDHVHGLESVPFKGTTDALTALRLSQASCNGKSRLFAALARRAGIPTRLVGGLILGSGTKRTSHQWVEAWINGVWVPFCPLNGHFAEIPAHYLRLYTGDEVLFAHTANINFDYEFTIRKRLVGRASLEDAVDAPPWASTQLWERLDHIGISRDILRVLLLLPLGAMVTVIFRNVIGLRVYGTFLPALIAVACRGTGLVWGLLGFALLLAGVGLARFFLTRMNLLHTPKLAFMLTLVIIGMIVMSVASATYGVGSLAYISLFPIAVTTLTTERFAITVQEEGWCEAISTSLFTALAVAACYVVMESPAMQSVFLAFPELLLVVLAVDLWLGRWMGLRLTEYRRFGGLIGG